MKSSEERCEPTKKVDGKKKNTATANDVETFKSASSENTHTTAVKVVKKPLQLKMMFLICYGMELMKKKEEIQKHDFIAQAPLQVQVQVQQQHRQVQHQQVQQHQHHPLTWVCETCATCATCVSWG